VSRRLAAIVDPYTSGAYLAESLRRRGYECLSVQSQPVVPEVFRSSFRPGDFVEVVQHEGDPAKTSARIAGRDVEFVIAGCELGVELADELSEALGLPSNGTAARNARRDKGLMAVAFGDAGLRVPRQLCSSELGPLLRWARSQAARPLVVKPSNSSSSDGVQLCSSEDDIERAFRSILGQKNVLGLTNRQVVAQEYLSGPEYVIDTVSREGCHQLVACWRYRKPPPTASFIGYDSMELLPGAGEVQERLLGEACGGLDALEIRIGPAHTELVWTDSGPVLLEIGARMHGGENPRLAGLCGARSHIGETVRAYADSAPFATSAERGYELSRHCTVAFLMPATPGRLRALPRLREIEALEAFHEMEIADCLGEPAPRVIGWVALVHEAKDVVDRQLAELRRLEADGLYEIDPL
jgi:hypothetical protein